MVEADDRARRMFAAEVTKALASQDFRDMICGDLIVAMPADGMGAIFRQLMHMGPCATLVAPFRQGIGAVRFDSMRGEVSDDQSEDDCDVHELAEVGLFMDFLRQHRRPVRCQLVSPTCEVELIGDGDEDLLVTC